MHSLITEYLEDHRLAWAVSTFDSESARLNSIYKLIGSNYKPEQVYKTLKKSYKPYTLKQSFQRLVLFNDWLIQNNHMAGPNEYKIFMEKNARLFKYAYKREELSINFKEAKSRIQRIKDPVAKNWALHVLFNGLRISEINKTTANKITGKGNKVRTLFNKQFQNDTLIKPEQLRYQLNKVGLKPHTLRKLFATELVRRGVEPHDLCEIMGWSSIETAYYYLQPKKEEQLKQLVNSL